MHNLEKLAKLGTKDVGRRQKKQKTLHYRHTNTNNVNKSWAYKNILFERKHETTL